MANNLILIGVGGGQYNLAKYMTVRQRYLRITVTTLHRG